MQPVARISDGYILEKVRQLQNSSSLRLQMYCQAKSGFVGRSYGKKLVQLQHELRVVVYGQASLSEPVGHYLQKCEFYLQDPEHCDCNVPYTNPQCLSHDEIVMTGSLNCLESTSETVHDPSGIFDTLSTTLELAETETPKTLKTNLKRYLSLTPEAGASAGTNISVAIKSRPSHFCYSGNVAGHLIPGTAISGRKEEDQVQSNQDSVSSIYRMLRLLQIPQQRNRRATKALPACIPWRHYGRSDGPGQNASNDSACCFGHRTTQA